MLRAVIQSFSHSWARWVLLAVTLATGLAFAVTGFPILASIMAVGALQAWHMGSERPKGRPMGRVEIAMVLTGFGLFLAAHGAAVYYGAVLIGWNPF